MRCRNVHGGIYQVVDVQVGQVYEVSGVWSGGIGQSDSQPFDIAWFEVTVYQGAVGAAEIDAAPGPDDVVIAKREYSGDSIISFGWEPFNGSFVTQQSQVTLAFKTGKVSPNWHPIAAFHDDVALQSAAGGIPTLGPIGVLVLMIVMAVAGLMVLCRRSF